MSTTSASARAAIMQYTRGTSGSSSNSISSENLPPRTLARLAREVRDLQKNPPEGVRLVVDKDSGLPSNLSELVAEVAGPQGTPYEGKFFFLKLVFGVDFPASPPRGFFLTKIYHPNVDVTQGSICVNTLKRDWSSTTTLCHVLAVIRCLLIVPFPESSLNDEAGKLFMESYDEYAKRARLMADVHGRAASSVIAQEQSQTATHDDDVKPAAAPTSDSTMEEAFATASAVENATRGVLKNHASNNTKAAAPSVTKKMSKKKSLKRL